MILLQLMIQFLMIGAFSFGGGLASMELIRQRVVVQQAWLTNSEFSDIISISEMTPGPLGINIASFVGVRIAGIPGTVAATVSYVIPSILIVIALAWVYFRFRSLKGVQGVLKGLRPAIAAMVIASAIRLSCNAFWGSADSFDLPSTNIIAVLVCALMLVLLAKKKLSPVKAIILSGFIGAAVYGIAGALGLEVV